MVADHPVELGQNRFRLRDEGLDSEISAGALEKVPDFTAPQVLEFMKVSVAQLVKGALNSEDCLVRHWAATQLASYETVLTNLLLETARYWVLASSLGSNRGTERPPK